VSARIIYGDMTVFSAGGTSLLDSCDGVTLKVLNASSEGKPVSRIGKSPQLVKKSFEISTAAMSNVTGVNRVTNLNLSALTVGATDYLAHVDGISINGSFDQQEGSARGDLWSKPEVVAKDYSGNLTLLIPTAGLVALQTLAVSNTVADAYSTLSFTINGVATTLPIMFGSYTHIATMDDLQKIEIEYSGRDLLTGAYPTAPTGTSSLLTKAFNDPRNELTFAFTPAAVNATQGAWSGNMTWSSFSYSVNSDDVVKTEYVWKGFGAPTVVYV
jgi:hypothetical protein